MKKYLLPETGHFYKANLHCHTVLSDGEQTPQEVKDYYKAHGYSVVAFTDHDVFIPHNDLTDDEFVAMGGFEVEINEKGKPFSDIKCCHICFVALDENIEIHPLWHRTKYISGGGIPESSKLVKFDPNKPDYNRFYTAECVNDMMRIGRESNFFVTYNHPNWSLENYNDYMSYNNMDAMEIYNYSSERGGYLDYCPTVYDDMLRGGKKIFCIATDDNHSYFSSCGGFTMIKAESLSYQNIAKNLKAGNFYASSGPKIHSLWVEDNVVHITCSPANRIYLNGNVRCSKAVFAGGDDDTITEASFSLRGHEGYFRLTVLDVHGKFAETNAYYIDDVFEKPKQTNNTSPQNPNLEQEYC